MSQAEAADWIARAKRAEQAGDIANSARIYDEALLAFADQPALANSAGDFSMRHGDRAKAAKLFEQACRLAPTNIEYAVNHAIALQALGKFAKALASLKSVEGEAAKGVPKYCSVRATCERARGNLGEAAWWYDRAIRLNPRHVKAHHGRARVAIERAEVDAVARFDLALALNSGEADLWLGKAQALDVSGEVASARSIAEQLCERAPAWVEGLRFLAQLRLAAGEKDFTSHYRTAADRAPDARAIFHDWIEQLAGLDLAKEAAEVAAEAKRRFPNEPLFALVQAVHAGSAGEDDNAEKIFASLAFDAPLRSLHEARHRIRRGELEEAEALIDAVLSVEPENIAAWALIGIVWRLIDDARAEWLHGQSGLYRQMPLEGHSSVLSEASPLLHRLHDKSPLPLGQSLRGGTQTRGQLFDRIEPELKALHNAILRTVERYRRELPAEDPTHPLLRHRVHPWKITNSWSVRLSGGGDYHTSHIHPQGVISSALYFERSNKREEDPHAGWLEIGRPPPDLRLDLPPLELREPKPGHLTLFPSTLYHGTRPFGADRRMTVAFDVVPVD